MAGAKDMEESAPKVRAEKVRRCMVGLLKKRSALNPHQSGFKFSGFELGLGVFGLGFGLERA
jgi:hypothetical protein